MNLIASPPWAGGVRLQGVLASWGLVGLIVLGPGVVEAQDGTSPPVQAILVLDTSGSMRETPDAVDSDDRMPLVDTVAEGELVGDDPASKLAIAKRVVTEVILSSPRGARFTLGKYRQSSAAEDFGPELHDRFLYSTTDSRAAEVIVNPGGDGASRPGLKRARGDRRLVQGTMTYYLLAGRFWNGERVSVHRDGSKPVVIAGSKGSRASFVEIQVRGHAGELGQAVRFDFRGIRWNRANKPESPADRVAVLSNNTSCGGFESLVELASTGSADSGLLDRYLSPEIKLLGDGTIKGYRDGYLGGPPAAGPAEGGLRASGMTPIAESLIDIEASLSSETAVAADEKQRARTLVLLVTDGDDTCTDERSGDVAAGRADLRALRAAHKAQLLFQRNANGVRRSTPVFVVSFGTAVSARRANWIAWAGSGMVRESSGTGSSARWDQPPTAQDRVLCAQCVDAFQSRNEAELAKGLRAAIARGLAP